MFRNACNGENGEKSPEGWRFKLGAKSGRLESDDFGKIGHFGKNGNLDGKKSPEDWRFKLDGKSVPLMKSGYFSTREEKFRISKRPCNVLFII